jgi:hypothetical protein
MKTILIILFLLVSSIYSNDCKRMEVIFKRIDRINGRNVTYVYKDTTQIKEWIKYNDINIARDLKVSITSIGFTINEDKDSFGYKTADCSIGLSVEGYLYKPLSNTGIIKEIISNYFTAENTTIITSASTI